MTVKEKEKGYMDDRKKFTVTWLYDGFDFNWFKRKRGWIDQKIF